MTLSIEFLQVGSTRHQLKMVSAKSPALKVAFPATVALIHHECFGYILFDTGYSPRFHEITKNLPEKLYALVTPVDINPKDTLIEQLRLRNIKNTEIKLIILSHFHADHIGGVSDFPTAEYLYLKQAYEAVRHLNRFRAVFNGFLKKLLPDDFLDRSNALTITPKNSTQLDYDYFSSGYDVLGDGSLLAIELPGHAPGHIGLMVHTDKGRYFLVGDACWVKENFTSESQPHWLVRRLVLHDAVQYKATLNKLKCFHNLYPEVNIIPCHCRASHGLV